MLSEKARHARALFDGIAATYEAPAAGLSLGQYGRWRRVLVRALPFPRDARALDVATGTGLIARAIERRTGARVVGLDQSAEMLREARRRGRGRLIGGDADALPFPDGAFDAVTFSYLLRYVPHPERTLEGLARVLRPGGLLGSVEFGVPDEGVLRAGWRAYACHVMPAVARALGPGWRGAGSFLGPSIVAWNDAWPLARQLRAWDGAGIEVRFVRRLTFGAGVVIVGAKRGG